MMFPGRVRPVADSPSPEPTADEGKFKSCHPDQELISWMMFPGRVRPVADSPSPEPTADEGKFKSCHPDQISHYYW